MNIYVVETAFKKTAILIIHQMSLDIEVEMTHIIWAKTKILDFYMLFVNNVL